MQFVINDDVSGMVDNNRNSDFELPLLDPPSEDDVIESRAEKIKSWERRIRKVSHPPCCTSRISTAKRITRTQVYPVRLGILPTQQQFGA